jgi:large subunit ribosomal protein L29
MKPDEIRALADEEIHAEIEDLKEELMRLRFQQATGELTDYTRLSQLRRNIARLNTILNERKRAAEMEGEG